jgi:hypothetical protein
MNLKQRWNRLALVLSMLLLIGGVMVFTRWFDDNLKVSAAMKNFRENSSYFVSNGTVERELARASDAKGSLSLFQTLHFPGLFRKEEGEVRSVEDTSYLRAINLAEQSEDSEDKIYCNLYAMRRHWPEHFHRLHALTVQRNKKIEARISVGSVVSVPISSGTNPPPPGWKPLPPKPWWTKLWEEIQSW